jgi:hypothetical protein
METMKFLVLPVIVLISGCFGRVGSEQSVAQCQLEAFGSFGTVFRQNYAGESYSPHARDAAYRDFMLTCMQSNGFTFKDPMVRGGNLNSKCWIEDLNGGVIPDALVDDYSCYARS